MERSHADTIRPLHDATHPQRKPNEDTSDSETDRETRSTSRSIKPKDKIGKKTKQTRSMTPTPRTKARAEQQQRDSEMAEDEDDTHSNILVKMELDQQWRQMYIQKGDNSDRIWDCCQTAMNEAHYHGRGFDVHCYGTLVSVNNPYDNWKNHIVHTHEPTGQETATIIVQITPYQQGPEDDQTMQAQAEYAENQQKISRIRRGTHIRRAHGTSRKHSSHGTNATNKPRTGEPRKPNGQTHAGNGKCYTGGKVRTKPSKKRRANSKGTTSSPGFAVRKRTVAKRRQRASTVRAKTKRTNQERQQPGSGTARGSNAK